MKNEENNPDKPEEKGVVMLDVFAINKQELIEKVANYTNLVVTRDTLKEAKAGLQTLRQLRYDIQNQQKANDKARIEWNNRMMDSNKLNAAELIDIIKPVEDPLEEKVKLIDAEIQAEKDAEIQKKNQRIDARVKLITDTGAAAEAAPDGKGGSVTMGYILKDQYISMDEIRELPDGTFNRVVKTFQDTAAAIAEEAEKLRLAEEAKADRIRTRTAKLFQIGMVKGPDGFVLPFATETAFVPFTDNHIADMEDDRFNKSIEASEKKIKEKADTDAKAKAESDRIAEEQKAESDRLAGERQQLDREKKQMQDDMVESRRGQLISIGFTADDNAMVFDTLIVYPETMRNMTSVEWNSHVQGLTKDVNSIKAEHEKKEKIDKCIAVLKNHGWTTQDNSTFTKLNYNIRLETITSDLSKFDDTLKKMDDVAQNIEYERIKKLMPDKEKLELLLQDLLKIQLPKVKTGEAKDILASVNAGINTITDHLSAEIKSLS